MHDRRCVQMASNWSWEKLKMLFFLYFLKIIYNIILNGCAGNIRNLIPLINYLFI